jgi:hypothetical protein
LIVFAIYLVKVVAAVGIEQNQIATREAIAAIRGSLWQVGIGAVSGSLRANVGLGCQGGSGAIRRKCGLLHRAKAAGDLVEIDRRHGIAPIGLGTGVAIYRTNHTAVAPNAWVIVAITA